jgi:hypothetical protein
MDFSISEMDLSICAPKNNHINCIIIILKFVNLSLKENVIISVFILKVPIFNHMVIIALVGFFFSELFLFVAKVAIICRKMWKKWAII